MEDFEFLRKVNIGIYLPSGSPIHRLDPRAKIISFLLLVAAATLAPSIPANLGMLFLTLGLIAIARIPFGYAMAGIKPAIPFLIAIAFLDLIFAPHVASGTGCMILWHWWALSVSNCVLRLIALIFIRFGTLILLTALLTSTTSTAEMGRGMESLLLPLNRFGVPGYELAMIFSLTFRFVPSFALEAERLVKAQLARGADFGEGGRWKFTRRARAMLPLMVPFFLMALQRAETMALAMEARGFVGGKRRTYYRSLHFRRQDALAIAASLAVAILAVLAG